MVTSVISCCHCESEQLVKNGYAPNGKQKYLCRACGKSSRENAVAKGYPEERKEEILKAYQERSSMRGLTRTFGVSRTTARYDRVGHARASFTLNVYTHLKNSAPPP